MEITNENQNQLTTGLAPTEYRAMALLESVIWQMYVDFKEFKKNNPNSPKVKIQADRFNSMFDLIDTINKHIRTVESMNVELSNMKLSLAQAAQVINGINEAKAKKEAELNTEIERLKGIINFN